MTSIASNIHIDIQVATEAHYPPSSMIEKWAKTAISNQLLPEAELSIRIVDEQEIAALNQQYRNKNKSTNVLSFTADLPNHIDLPLLGDIVICASVVEKEAREQQKTAQSHWAHMIIHGTLHLLGYDHIDETEAAVMENLEVTLLASLGIDNPYHYPETKLATNH